jgi:hypothetical protein
MGGRKAGAFPIRASKAKKEYPARPRIDDGRHIFSFLPQGVVRGIAARAVTAPVHRTNREARGEEWEEGCPAGAVTRASMHDDGVPSFEVILMIGGSGDATAQTAASAKRQPGAAAGSPAHR